METPDTVPEIRRTVDRRHKVERGDRVILTKRITEDDVHSFGRATGDENPLHLDSEYASETRFNGRIAHGVLGMGMLSGALANFPGCPILLEWKKTPFETPIPIGGVYQAEAEVKRTMTKNRFDVELTLREDGGDDAVLETGAVIKLDPEPEV